MFTGESVSVPVPTCDTDTLPWLTVDGGGAWTPYNAVDDEGVTVADLSYGAAYQLCLWINQGEDLCNEPAVAAGYASGQAATCTTTSAAGVTTSMAMVWLGLDDCVANLRHSPCGALVSDLTQCVQYFGSHAAELDCSAAASACAAFESVAGCNETVVQANPHADTTNPLFAGCAASLPLVGGVECPPASAPQGSPPPLDGGDE
jgi:hypothetical protein